MINDYLPMSSDPEEVHKTFLTRAEIIKLIRDGTIDRRDLVEQVDLSRPSVDRILRELEDLGILASTGSEYRLTLLGREGDRSVSRALREVGHYVEAEDLIQHLPEGTKFDARIIAEGEIVRSERPVPHGPRLKLTELLSEGHRIRWLTPVVEERGIDQLYEVVVEGEREVLLLISERLSEYLWASEDKHWRPIVDTETSTIRVLPSPPPYGLLVVDDREVWFGVFDEVGNLRGCIVNDSPSAISWAENRFERFLEDSHELVLRSSGAI